MPTDPAEFRRQATVAFSIAVVVVLIATVVVAWLGWRVGGIWGLVAGIVIGGAFALAALVMAAFLWAMTQDGA